jgi:hypothetical protein
MDGPDTWFAPASTATSMSAPALPIPVEVVTVFVAVKPSGPFSP